MSRGLRRSGARREAAAWSLWLTCDPFRFGSFGPANVWSYPTFPPSLKVSYLIQISKAIRLKVNKRRALSSPPPPKRPCGIRAYKTPARPRWGLCFCVSRPNIII
jgi:hypothetical protein